MLSINWIKATDVNPQKRQKPDFLQTQTDSFSIGNGHMKNSKSAPFFESSVGFVAGSPLAKNLRKTYVPKNLNTRVSMSIERRRPI